MDKITAAKLNLDTIPSLNVGENDQVLYNPGDGLKVCTIEHIGADNKYYLKGMYEGYTKSDPIFFKFIVEDGDQKRTVKFSHWRRLLTSGAKIGDVLEWKITSKPFKEGDYSSVCSNCSGWFDGAKRQPLCKGCCEKLAYAGLHGHEDKKAKRPRLINPSIVDIMLKECYQGGVNGISWEEISKRVKNKLADGSYRIKN